MNMDALLIIDMQNECFDVPRQNKDVVVANINRISSYFRKSGKLVIFIQHNGIKDQYLYPGTPGYEIIPDLVVSEGDLFIEKKVNSAFYQTSLLDTLRSHGVETIYITGLATEFCVNATIMAGLEHDFSIVIAGDAHLTADREIVPARKITEFYNWLWANLIPTGGSISVIGTDDILTRR
jgi:nicotinamidase-related amidase